MVFGFSEGVTRKSAPASMAARAVSASRMVPAPSSTCPPNWSATFSMTRMAPGTVMVISMMGMPPRWMAPAAWSANSALVARTTGIRPVSMIRCTICSRVIKVN